MIFKLNIKDFNYFQSIDRYSLAIQEILKLHGISPGNSILWEEFPETQREVMLPLLSSRYMIAQPNLASNLPTPIYGSNSGASFQSWLYKYGFSTDFDYVILCNILFF